MRPFTFVDAATVDEAANTFGANSDAMFFAGGTTLVDLMKLEVMIPGTLVNVGPLPLRSISVSPHNILVGANVRNSELAHHRAIRERYPVLAEALLSGASAQLRNMATTAGNMLQKTRCSYFRDITARCNKREPGSGCDALNGINRSHAILGTSEHCIAVFPSDMCTALAILDPIIHTRKTDGSTREIAFRGFHLLPGSTPDRENALERGELITHLELPDVPVARRSHYLKVRDRASYEFALASAAVAFELDGDRIVEARIALGGIATRPWRAIAAESTLAGRKATRENFRAAAEAALAQAKPRQHNQFKVELAKRTLVFAFEELLQEALRENLCPQPW